MEHIPTEKTFWSAPVVAGSRHRWCVTSGMTCIGLAAFALRPGQPVISNHLENEEHSELPSYWTYVFVAP